MQGGYRALFCSEGSVKGGREADVISGCSAVATASTVEPQCKGEPTCRRGGQQWQHSRKCHWYSIKKYCLSPCREYDPNRPAHPVSFHCPLLFMFFFCYGILFPSIYNAIINLILVTPLLSAFEGRGGHLWLMPWCSPVLGNIDFQARGDPRDAAACFSMCIPIPTPLAQGAGAVFPAVAVGHKSCLKTDL